MIHENSLISWVGFDFSQDCLCLRRFDLFGTEILEKIHKKGFGAPVNSKPAEIVLLILRGGSMACLRSRGTDCMWDSLWCGCTEEKKENWFLLIDLLVIDKETMRPAAYGSSKVYPRSLHVHVPVSSHWLSVTLSQINQIKKKYFTFFDFLEPEGQKYSNDLS